MACSATAIRMCCLRVSACDPRLFLVATEDREDEVRAQHGGKPCDYHAVTIGDVILVRPQYAENVRVLREELIHVFQQRGGMAVTDIVAQEIEARLMMIAQRHQRSLTVDEVKE